MEFDRCSHAIFHFFSKYLKTFNHKIKKIQADGCMLNVIVFYFCHIHDRLCQISALKLRIVRNFDIIITRNQKGAQNEEKTKD